MNKWELAAVIFIAAFGMVAYGWHCCSVGVELVRREAIRVGAAHYVADDDGCSQFQWKARE